MDLSAADRALASGKWVAAAEEYAAAVAGAPSDPSIEARLAQALVFDNQPAAALPHAQRAVDLDSRSAFNQAVLALVLNWKGSTDLALAAARRATDLDPKMPEAQAYLAEALTDKYQLSQAQDALSKAVAAGGSDNPEVLREQGYLQESHANYTAAIQSYQHATQVAPDRSYLYISLAGALKAAQQLDAAVAAYTRAGELDPHDARAEGGLGSIAYAQEDYSGAEAHLRQALAIDPDYTNAYGQLGWTYYVQKQYDKAEPEFIRAAELEKDPSRNAEYRHALGWIYVSMKRYDDARNQFTLALQEKPDLAGAKDGLAEVARQTGH